MSLVDLSDAELDQEITDRIVERERRALMRKAEADYADLVAAYEEAVGAEPATPIGDVPSNGAVGPGGRIVDADNIEWVNQSGAWLSPHVAGPSDYPMGWRLANSPDPTETAPWTAGETVTAGDLRVFEGVTYRCIQGHTTQSGWTPPVVPALWAIA